MNPYAGRVTGIGNPFASGVPFGQMTYSPPGAGYNRNAASPMTGSWSYQPVQRNDLAQLMALQSVDQSKQGMYGGGRPAGYTTSGPRSGGGWGWGGGARSSATHGGLFGGGLY